MKTEKRSITGFRSERADINGITLHYWIGGDPHGRPLLLWHGFLGTAFTWHKLMPMLAKAGYSVLVPDMRGYGDSDKPQGNEGYDGRALAEEFRTLVERIAFRKGDAPLTLVAHDMGAPPAILWAADHPEEIAAVLYVEAPVMLQSLLEEMINFTPAAMAWGSMWWWILPLAPGVPEALMVGREREFLSWFYRGRSVAKPDAIASDDVDEYLRTFCGTEGVLGSLGVYRTVFVTAAQTLPLAEHKVKVPIVAVGGEKGLGERVGQFVSEIASNVKNVLLPGCGHFVPEECPEALLEEISRLAVSLQEQGR